MVDFLLTCKQPHKSKTPTRERVQYKMRLEQAMDNKTRT